MGRGMGTEEGGPGVTRQGEHAGKAHKRAGGGVTYTLKDSGNATTTESATKSGDSGS